jgi:hypothetical protein
VGVEALVSAAVAVKVAPSGGAEVGSPPPAGVVVAVMPDRSVCNAAGVTDGPEAGVVDASGGSVTRGVMGQDSVSVGSNAETTGGRGAVDNKNPPPRVIYSASAAIVRERWQPPEHIGAPLEDVIECRQNTTRFEIRK